MLVVSCWKSDTLIAEQSINQEVHAARNCVLWAEHPHPPTSLARPSRFRQLPLGASEACRGRADRGSRCDQSANAKPAMACPRSHPSRYTDNPGWYARWSEKRDTHALGSRQQRVARRLAERCGLFLPVLTCPRSGSSPIPSTTASELAWCLTLAVGERGVTEAPRRPGVLKSAWVTVDQRIP